MYAIKYVICDFKKLNKNKISKNVVQQVKAYR
jgi:hypothetical protein